MMHRLLRALSNAFSMDLRSLAAARICLAIAILADLEQKSRFLTTFYTDEGILPRAALINFFHQPYFFSFHLASGDAWFQIILFLVAAVFALLLLFGYKTRTVTVISWFLLCSLQARNLPILNAGDGILRLLLFWSIFLPMGSVWSVDRALNEGKAPPSRVFSVGTIAWVTQVLLIYWVTVALRNSPEWLSDGSALYFALHIDQLTTGLGRWLSAQPLGLLQFLTWCAVAIEAGAPLLLLIPDRRGIARFLGCLLGISFHFGIFLMMHIGVFPFICMISWIALLPGGFWDLLHRYLGGAKSGMGLAIYYDGACGFCKKTVLLMRSFLGLEQTTIAPASGEALTLMEQENSWVVVTPDGRSHLRWEGMVQVLRHSPLFWLAPLAHGFRGLGGPLYRWVAGHRSLLSFMTRPLAYRPLRPLGWLGKGVAVLGLLLALGWNAQVLKLVELPPPVQAATLLLRLDQYWNMFAPFPLKDDGWYVVPGTLVNGTEIDLLRGDTVGTVSFDKPADLATSFPTESWRKYFLNLWLKDFEKYREFYAEYHCRRWNSTHTGDERLKTLFIHFMREPTPKPELRGTEKAEKLTIWEWHCGGIE